MIRALVPKRIVPAARRAAFVEAKPVFQKHCYRCHTSTGLKAKPKAMKHLKMDRYPFTGPHSHEAAAVILRALAGDKEKGEKPTMPADDLGALSDAELRKVLAWADAFERSRAQASKRPAAPTSPAPSPHDHHGGSK
jgi:mono/diheme cytochrome c family protein